MDSEPSATFTTQSDRPADLCKKLVAIMAAVQSVPKKGFNQDQNYHYVQESDLVEAIRTEMVKQSVLLVPSVESVERRDGTTKSGSPRILATVVVRYRFIDAETGETLECTWQGDGMDSPGDKAIYKAYTGGHKYFLTRFFQVPSSTDPERDTTRPRAQAKPTEKQVKERAHDADQRRFFAVLKQCADYGIVETECGENNDAGKQFRRARLAQLLNLPTVEPEQLTPEQWRDAANALSKYRDEKVPVKP